MTQLSVVFCGVVCIKLAVFTNSIDSNLMTPFLASEIRTFKLSFKSNISSNNLSWKMCGKFVHALKLTPHHELEV